MKTVLGLETSCDETAAAVVTRDENGRLRLISESLASSAKLHERTGGIVPETAARKQLESIIPVINACTKNAGLDVTEIDAIAVTYGPGLIGSLLVGVETAKALSYSLRKPLIPVNHLQAHIFVNWLDHSPSLPAIGLVVSGGHSDFVLIEKNLKVSYLGGTRDDAAGEAFDKTARILGLNYPGGPEIAKRAEMFIKENEDYPLNLFPRPMAGRKDLDMSFSGLKTAIKNYLDKNPNQDTNMICAQIQEAIIDTIVAKSMLAIKKHKPKSFILSGGVSANSRLRKKVDFSRQRLAKDVLFYVPQPRFSTDNAVMVAVTALLKNNTIGWKDLTTYPSLPIER